MRAHHWRILLLLFVMLAPRSGWAQTSIQYTYDDLGRLIAVVDPGGDTAVYHYDAVGNVLSIDRHASSQVSIISFSPGTGPVATTVTINGTGFSATPSSNSVTFNGTAATVTTATATKLVVTVPSGATTGTIGVTAPAGSATSATAFTVGSLNAPTITSFTPGTAVSGTALTVNGTNFETVASHDNLKVNISPTQVTSATTTELQTTVPPSAGTGHVSVTTPKGMAVTSGYLWVAPAPYVVADVDSTGTLALDTGTTVSVSTANKMALRAFEGTEGHRASILITNGTGGSDVSLYSPFGTLMNYAGASATGFVDAVDLRSTATYAIVFDPSTTSATSATLTVYDVPPDFSGSMTAGSPVTVEITTPGQNGLLTFGGTSGQRISLAGTAGTILNQIIACDVYVSILKPDTSEAGSGCMEGTGFIDVITLPATGVYPIAVGPVSTATGDLTLTLYSVPADVTGTITAGGSAVTVTNTTPGQNGSLTFSGTAGNRVALQASGITGQIAFACDVNVSLLKPDTTALVSPTCMEGTAFLDTLALPTTGTYTIVVDPLSSVTGGLVLTLLSVPADVSGTITAGGSAVTVTTTATGQNGALTFSGTAGQRVSMLASGISGQLAFICDVNVSLLKPDSSVLAGPTCMEGTSFFEVATLPTTGTYTIFVDPTTTVTGALTITLYSVPADTTGTITLNGSAVTVTTTQPGQKGSLTFSGTAAQQVALQWTSNSMSTVRVKLLGTDGTTVLTQAISSAASVSLSVATLPSTGTYTISVDPDYANIGSITLTAAAPAATLLVNSTGPPVELVVATGANVTVGVAGGPAHTTDWVGMHLVGGADSPALAWKYLNGTQSAPGTGLSSATLTFTMPSTSTGRHEFRFFASNGYSRLAISTHVITTSTASVSVNGSAVGSPITVAPSASVTVGVAGGPANTTDWVGLYPVGGGISSYVAWKYMNGTQTAPGTGLSSATLTFTMPSTNGNYEFRFLANNGYTGLASSTKVAVITP